MEINQWLHLARIVPLEHLTLIKDLLRREHVLNVMLENTLLLLVQTMEMHAWPVTVENFQEIESLLGALTVILAHIVR